MFSQDDENSLFKMVKMLLYYFLIGALYYAGGAGWAVLFTRNEEKRSKIGNYNILLLLFEIFLVIVIFFVGFLNGGESNVNTNLIFTVFKASLFHLAVSVVGIIIYVIWWILSSIFPGLKYSDQSLLQIPEDNKSDFRYLQEESWTGSLELINIQNRLNESTNEFIERNRVSQEQKELRLKTQMVEIIKNVISSHKSILNIEEKDYENIDKMSVHELNNLAEDLQAKISNCTKK